MTTTNKTPIPVTAVDALAIIQRSVMDRRRRGHLPHEAMWTHVEYIQSTNSSRVTLEDQQRFVEALAKITRRDGSAFGFVTGDICNLVNFAPTDYFEPFVAMLPERCDNDNEEIAHISEQLTNAVQTHLTKGRPHLLPKMFEKHQTHFQDEIEARHRAENGGGGGGGGGRIRIKKEPKVKIEASETRAAPAIPGKLQKQKQKEMEEMDVDPVDEDDEDNELIHERKGAVKDDDD
jgi:hypothetical protein